MGYYMVFRGKGRGFSCRHQSIKVVLEKIDCQLTACGGRAWGRGNIRILHSLKGNQVNIIMTQPKSSQPPGAKQWPDPWSLRSWRENNRPVFKHLSTFFHKIMEERYRPALKTLHDDMRLENVLSEASFLSASFIFLITWNSNSITISR